MRNLFLSVLFMLATVSVSGQGETEQLKIEHVSIPASFIGTEENKIDGTEYLAPVYGRLTRAGDSTVRVLQLGDSHVRGFSLPRTIRRGLEYYFGSEAMEPDSASVRDSLYMAKETGEPGVLFSAIGVNGIWARHMDKEYRLNQIEEYKPDLIILSFGTNESHDYINNERHTNQMDSLVAHLRQRCPDATLLFTTPPGSHLTKRVRRRRKGRRRYVTVKVNNPRTIEVANNIVKFCHENEIACWNLYGIMGGREYACRNWKSAALMRPDKVHYTLEGYKLQGELFVEAFMKGYNEYLGH